MLRSPPADRATPEASRTACSTVTVPVPVVGWFSTQGGGSMRLNARWLAVVPLVVLVAVLVGQVTSSRVSAQGRVVTMHDNNAPSPAPPQNLFDPAQGRWRFDGGNVGVGGGEQMVFQSRRGTHHGHTVTSLVGVGGPFPAPVQLRGGTLFASSPTNTAVIQPGQSFTLD